MPTSARQTKLRYTSRARNITADAFDELVDCLIESGEKRGYVRVRLVNLTIKFDQHWTLREALRFVKLSLIDLVFNVNVDAIQINRVAVLLADGTRVLVERRSLRAQGKEAVREAINYLGESALRACPEGNNTAPNMCRTHNKICPLGIQNRPAHGCVY